MYLQSNDSLGQLNAVSLMRGCAPDLVEFKLLAGISGGVERGSQVA